MLVAALLNAQESILFVSLLMFLVFFAVAIFSVMEFKENDRWRFGDLHTSLMTLFRVATGDDWTDVMYTAQFGCKLYASGPATAAHLCTDEGNKAMGWTAVIFFIFFHIMGGLVFLNLFIGVITVGMADAMEERDEEQYTLNRVKRLQHSKKSKMSVHAIESYTRAFYALDLTLDAKLDVHDIKWALEALFFTPSEKDVNDLIFQTASKNDLVDMPIDGELDLYDFIHSMENWETILELPHHRDESMSVEMSVIPAVMHASDVLLANTEGRKDKKDKKESKKRPSFGKKDKKDSKKRSSPTSTATSLKTSSTATTRTIV